MTLSELKLLLRILPSFAKHYKQNPHSLIAKILGIFTVKCAKMGEVHIMLMENTLDFKDPDRVKFVFDLKGSTVDRRVKTRSKRTTTLKDCNFLKASQCN